MAKEITFKLSIDFACEKTGPATSLDMRACVNEFPLETLTFGDDGRWSGKIPTITGERIVLQGATLLEIASTLKSVNQNAERALEAGRHDGRIIEVVRPTEDPSIIFAVSRDDAGIDMPHFLPRRAWLEAKKLFGTEDIGVGFFEGTEIDCDSAPIVLVEDWETAFAAGWPGIEMRRMTEADKDILRNTVDLVIATEHEGMIIVVAASELSDMDPRISHVDRYAWEMDCEGPGQFDFDELSLAGIDSFSRSAALRGDMQKWIERHAENYFMLDRGYYTQQLEAKLGREDAPVGP